jgi:hypothetical protein
VLRAGGRWIASSFVASPGKRRSQGRFPTAERIAAWAADAGLVQFSTNCFRRYLLAWADKPGRSLHNEPSR